MGRSDRQISRRPEPISDRDYVLPFGKYRGRALTEVLRDDGQYLNWLHNNAETFELSAELLAEAMGESTEPDRYRDAKPWAPVKAAPPPAVPETPEEKLSHTRPYRPDDDTIIPF